MNDLPSLVRSFGVVAVLGAHADLRRPAGYVPDALHRAGIRVLPVNRTLVGATLWGEPVRATLDACDAACDAVDVFRRAEDLPAHVDEILAMRPLPRVVWFQTGIRNDTVAGQLEAAGIIVVQDRCLMVDRRRWA